MYISLDLYSGFCFQVLNSVKVHVIGLEANKAMMQVTWR